MPIKCLKECLETYILFQSFSPSTDCDKVLIDKSVVKVLKGAVVADDVMVLDVDCVRLVLVVLLKAGRLGHSLGVR